MILRSILFRWLANRFSERRRQQSRRSFGRQPARQTWPPRRQQRGRGGFWGPFPYYSTRTRGGSRVTVSGCCLPLALALFSLPILGLRAIMRR
jgi:hypothetical protein